MFTKDIYHKFKKLLFQKTLRLYPKYPKATRGLRVLSKFLLNIDRPNANLFISIFLTRHLTWIVPPETLHRSMVKNKKLTNWSFNMVFITFLTSPSPRPSPAAYFEGCFFNNRHDRGIETILIFCTFKNLNLKGTNSMQENEKLPYHDKKHIQPWSNVFTLYHAHPITGCTGNYSFLQITQH